LIKKLAILAVAVIWLLGSESLISPSTTSPGKTGTSTRSSTSKSVKKSGQASAKGRRARRRHSRRRGRYRNPWRISSFVSDPTAEDDPAGEDPQVREAAVAALGQWNGAVVVVDPNTGRVLAIVNQRMALRSAFVPCSTFKPVVALGALHEGLITADTQLRVGRRTTMDLTTALAHSNNPFFAKLGRMLGYERLAQYAYLFGFGEKAGWKIPGEAPGRFPAAPPKEGGVGDLAYCGTDMSVTALQMAAAFSAIANGGTLYYLQRPRTPDEIAQFTPRVKRRMVQLTEYFGQLREGLAAAVIYGTGRMAYSPDEQIYGKTGTCSEDGARLGWFVSYANERQPSYVVVVLLRGGRLMYGPHAAQIAGQVYRDLRTRDHGPTQARHPDLSDSSSSLP
jgi:cell division protein FtsI/penicillin-binding protein 2